MAIQIIREVAADVVKRGATRAVYAKQHDINSRFLNVRIQEDGKDIIVAANLGVVLNVERPDHQKGLFYGTVNADGTVKVPLTTWMLELEGTLVCDISIVSDDPTVAKLTTMLFNIHVEAAVATDADIPETEDYNILVDLLARTSAACAEAESALEQAKEAKKTADDTSAALIQARDQGEFNGADGTSVSIVSITESEDGSSNTVKFSDGTTLVIKNGGKGDPGPQGVQGERGLSFIRLTSNLVGAAEYYPFTDFLIPDGYIPKVNDLVLYNDGNLGYIHSVNTSEQIALVAYISGVSFKGPQGVQGEKGEKGENGVSPSIDVSKTGKVTTIKITDASGTKTATINDGADGAGGGGNGISDWNQNDANGRGFINSRPFYEVNAERIIYENTDLQLQGVEATEARLPNQIDLIEGVPYLVSWEGKTHKVTATRSSDTSLDLGKAGEFLIRTTEGAAILDVDGNKTRILSYNGLTSVSLSIYTTQAAVKKIDKKFLPDDIGGGAELDSEIFNNGDTIIPETSLTLTEGGSGSETAIHSDVSAEIGKTYIVNWNGIKYNCIAKESNDGRFSNVVLGNGLLFDLPSANEPFTIRFMNEGYSFTKNVEIYSLDGLATATVEITTPQMINPKYIPDMYYTEERQDVEILPTSTAIDTGSAMMGELYVIGSPITLEVGKTYKVIYNGTEYESVASEFTLPQIGLSVGLGDVDVVTTGTPSGAYPFVLAVNDLLVQMGACAAVIPLDGSSNITVSILGEVEKIHHLPSKYIKDMYYEEVIEEKEILPEMTLTSTEFTVEGTLFTLKPNYPYKVIYNGTSYSCISKTYVADSVSIVYLGYSYILGGEKTGEPFGIFSIGGTTYFGNKDANVTISIIEGGKIVHKIDEKYIPPNPNVVPITRKINNKELSSDITLTATDLGAVPTDRTINGKALSSNIVISSREINGVEGKIYTIGGKTFDAKVGAEVFNTEANKAIGFWSHAEGRETIALGDSSHVEGRYNIPDEEHKYAHIVGNGVTSWVGNVSTEERSNAHTLDWSGNAWYAGSVECTAVIINSSTAGSTKKFKITVDDSGAITATEV